MSLFNRPIGYHQAHLVFDNPDDYECKGRPGILSRFEAWRRLPLSWNEINELSEKIAEDETPTIERAENYLFKMRIVRGFYYETMVKARLDFSRCTRNTRSQIYLTIPNIFERIIPDRDS